MAESQTLAPLRQRRGSMDLPLEFRLVLVGKTGAGKSSSGNTILGREAFRAAVSGQSVTRECCKQTDQMLNRKVTIVDTPGLFDTSLPEHLVKREISKCINMSAPGPHAILLAIQAGTFSAEDRDAVKKVEEIFGEDAWKYTIILFTHGDRVKSNFEQLVEEAGPELLEVLKKADSRYHVLNNHKTNDRGQVLHLLEKVEKMVKANGGGYYSNPTYLESMEMLDKREKELRKFYEKKLEEETEAVKIKYQKMLSEAAEERQQVEKRLQTELQELQRYCNVLQRGARHVVEQTMLKDSMEDIYKYHKTLTLNFTWGKFF